MDTKKLRQKILDLAIHGKLVPQDPNDEPASVLLERIRAEKERLIKEGKIKRSRKTAKTSDTPHYEQDMPFEVPENWVMVKASDIFNLNPKSNLDEERQIGFIPMALVEDGFTGRHSHIKRIWRDVKKGYCHFQDGDIGIAKISPCFENRKSVVFKNLPNGYGAGTTELVILRPLVIYAKFYLYLFKSDWYLHEGTKYFKGVVGQQRVHKEIFTDLHIPLPPLKEQQRIAAEIERWFKLIDTIEKGETDLQTAIKQAKSKILDLAIHGKLVPQDPNDEPASELLKRINPKAEITCDNEHSEKLPKGWYLSTLGDCFKWGSGGTPESTVKAYYEGNIPWLVIGDLNDSIVTFASKHISQLGIYNSSAKVLTKGTLLMAMYGSIGKLGIAGMELATNQAIAYAKPNEINTYYLFYYLLANRDNFYMLGKGGTQKNISQTLIKSYPFLLPPLAEQKRIVLKIEELFSIIDTVEQTLQA